MPAFIVEAFVVQRLRVRVRTFAESDVAARDKAAPILRDRRNWIDCRYDTASPPKNPTPLTAFRDHVYEQSQPGAAGSDLPEVRG